MGKGYDLVLLSLKSLFKLGNGDRIPYWSLNLIHFGAVGLKAGKRL